mgnify:FL=1
MSDKRAPRRSLDDWMELVTECRQSGLTDAAWCEAQGISPSCFYNAVSRLRKRACQIPDPIGKASTLDLTSHKQDVVQIAIEPETSPAELFQDERNSSMYLDNSHTIEIEAKGLNPVVVFVKTDEGNQTPVAFKTGINVKAGKDVIGE